MQARPALYALFLVVGLIVAADGCGGDNPAPGDAAPAAGGSSGSGGTDLAADGAGGTAKVDGAIDAPAPVWDLGAGGSTDLGSTTGVRSIDASGCSCAGNTMSWDCYCAAFDCNKTVTAYAGGLGKTYSLMREYAGCNLVEYWSLQGLAQIIDVFDLRTGKLVGHFGLVYADGSCPFGGPATPTSSFSTGQFAGMDCALTQCIATPASDMCNGVDAGARSRG